MIERVLHMYNIENLVIIIPVYKAFDDFLKCLNSIRRFYTKTRVIVINDCDSEEDSIKITSLIDHVFKDVDHNIVKVNNHMNLGFIKSCNIGCNLALSLDNVGSILLLNSDTILTNNSIQEMLIVLNTANKIGVVNPRTNNASIQSYPFTIDSLPIFSFMYWQITKTFLKPYHRIPTAVGFCMLVKSNVVRKYGLFDEIYGLGYNEENDFCMRILKHGYQCYSANRSFVYHKGKSSFGINKARILERMNRKILDERYPNYSKLVKNYLTKRKISN